MSNIRSKQASIRSASFKHKASCTRTISDETTEAFEVKDTQNFHRKRSSSSPLLKYAAWPNWKGSRDHSKGQTHFRGTRVVRSRTTFLGSRQRIILSRREVSRRDFTERALQRMTVRTGLPRKDGKGRFSSAVSGSYFQRVSAFFLPKDVTQPPKNRLAFYSPETPTAATSNSLE